MIDINELRQKLRSDDLIDHVDIHANVKPILAELINRLEAAEKERDIYKFGFNGFSEKTEWVQQGINDGTISTKYFGWHRADVMYDLLSAAEKERDALRAKITEMERQEPVGWQRLYKDGSSSEDFTDLPYVFTHQRPLYALPGAKGE